MEPWDSTFTQKGAWLSQRRSLWIMSVLLQVFWVCDGFEIYYFLFSFGDWTGHPGVDGHPPGLLLGEQDQQSKTVPEVSLMGLQ